MIPFFRTAAVVALAAGLAFPATVVAQTPSLSGLWDLTWETPRGEQTLRVELVQTDAAFTGTAEGRMGQMPVKEGKVEGDKVHFVVEMTMGRPGGDQTRTIAQTFEGTLKDGVIEGEIQMPAMGGGGGGGGRPGGMGGPRTFTMKRVEG